jgi:DNA-binding transcriptional regulator PaaX
VARNSTSDRVLAALRKDSLTISQLSERLGLTTSQVRSAVSRMVGNGEIVSNGGRPAEYRMAR